MALFGNDKSESNELANASSGAGSLALQKTGSANVVASGAIGVGQSGRYQEAGAVGGNQSLSNIGNSSVSAGGNLTVTSDAGVDASLAALQTALTNAQDQINSQSTALQTALTNVTPTPGAIPSATTTAGDPIFTKLKNWLAGYGLSATEVSVGLAAIALGIVFLIFKRRRKN